ncbi:ExbD/TolR family protein [Acuticoccus kandeliae]|uniref:ExbD/TolR family protein n=1 Tax=Acuticoccus kandeliae TaxID=2073160 RepID=UPI000D3ED59B|nr:biopolymer transporter ExbD [Acuticoccus kandeliae]
MAHRRRRPLSTPARRRDVGESTIPLINVVFLLLIFFLVAGTLSAPRDPEVDLATAQEFTPVPLAPDALYIAADGTLRVGGEAMNPAEAVAAIAAVNEAAGDATDEITVIPDRNLDAPTLLGLLGELRVATEIPLRLIVRRPSAGEGQ